MQLAILQPSDAVFPPLMLEALRQRRIQLGWTQLELSRRIHLFDKDGRRIKVGQSSLNTWEMRKATPTPNRLAAWAAALGVQVVVGLQEMPTTTQGGAA